MQESFLKQKFEFEKKYIGKDALLQIESSEKNKEMECFLLLLKVSLLKAEDQLSKAFLLID